MVDRDAELAIIRRAYAKQVMAAARASEPRVEAAFAAVKREAFLGPGRWPVFRWFAGYTPTPDDDPVHLYSEALTTRSAPTRRSIDN